MSPDKPGDRFRRVRVIDSHTGGEPTRLVIGGIPGLGNGDMAERRQILSDHHDWLRRTTMNEPRGSDILVGAVLQELPDPETPHGVIFFNNVGYLGMCGHGTIGLIASLQYLGRIQPGTHRIATPVGPVQATLHEDGAVSFENIPCHVTKPDVKVHVDGYGKFAGDIVWSGNWFFLLNEGLCPIPLDIGSVDELTAFALELKKALHETGHPEVDHVELSGAPVDKQNDSRNFVLCPGGAYDRSPCGTGTSAKVTSLMQRGYLKIGQIWRQESITGSVFTAKGSLDQMIEPGSPLKVIPTITGRAFITAESELILDQEDPLSNQFSESDK